MPLSISNVYKRYDVFLSFRGPDTREGFVGKLLYPALDAASIHTFLDQIRLDKGKHVFSSLHQAIEASRICIPIFSQNFVQSEWCLNEVLHMVHSQAFIWPLFYDVLPSDLRDGGKYSRDLELDEIRGKLSPAKIIECQIALRKVSQLCGWSFNQFSGEEELIQAVLTDVAKKLHKVHMDIPKCFGLEWSVHHVSNSLNVMDHNKKMGKVGIHGMSGIGKTTLAKVVFKQLYERFQAFCLVLDVGERCKESNGLVKMQTHMLRDISGFRGEVDHVDRGKGMLEASLRGKRVLLLLDDIRSPEQLEALAGNYGDFSPGSRLIITSSDQQILKLANVDEAYEVRRLSHKHALQLFNFHARPDQDLETLCNNIVSACEGLPLALQLLGKSMRGERERSVWVDTVEKLSFEPDLQKKLKISYESLDSYEKEMFQDIACFLRWEDKQMATMFWSEMIRAPHASFRHLLQKSLLSLGPVNELLMHSCLRDLGRSIAKEMSPEPRKRTRLFEEDDVQHVLCRPWEKAKARYVWYEPKEQTTVKAGMFESLYNLKLLWLKDVVIEDHFSEGALYFQDLRWLRWRRCCSKSLPLGLNLEKLVILEVTHSQITHLWDGRREEHGIIPPLKLEVLILSGCTSLESLPANLNYTRLQILDLNNCHSLRRLSNIVGNFSSLVHLSMEGCGISSLPEDFGKLSSLQKLNLSRCRHLSKLPASFGNLTWLEKLQIHHNPKLTELPRTFGGLKALLYLNAGYCQLSEGGLPAGMCELDSLKVIHLEHNPFGSLPWWFEKLSGVWEVHLEGCAELLIVPALPPSLEMLYAGDCWRLSELCCLTESHKLLRLDVRNSTHLTELRRLECAQRLIKLNLVGCNNMCTRTLVSCLGHLKALESLFIGGPGVSPDKLQSLFDSIQSMCFSQECLQWEWEPTVDVTSNWLDAVAAGTNGEEIQCTLENKLNSCAGYVVCCLTLGQAFPTPRNENSEFQESKRLRYSIQRDENLCPCEIIHQKLDAGDDDMLQVRKMDGGDDDMLELRIVRVNGDPDFECLRLGDKLRVIASSDFQTWKACFKFFMYEGDVGAISSPVDKIPPRRSITFGNE